MKQRRISFSEYDANRIYEWKLALNQGLGESCCEWCSYLEERLEKFIGKKDAEHLQKLVKKNPYFKKPRDKDKLVS